MNETSTTVKHSLSQIKTLRERGEDQTSPDAVDWFKGAGKGHLTRMNAVLRAYVEAQKQSHTPKLVKAR